MKNYKIYCDLDGVLVDFNKGYHQLTGIDISGKYCTGETFWQPIKKAGYDFWVNLTWTKDGKKLWNYILQYTPELLSAPSNENDSRIGKHDWVNKELPGFHLILRSPENKKEFASPNSILIDDHISNIEDWIKSGGIGIHHISADNTISQLKQLFL